MSIPVVVGKRRLNFVRRLTTGGVEFPGVLSVNTSGSRSQSKAPVNCAANPDARKEPYSCICQLEILLMNE